MSSSLAVRSVFPARRRRWRRRRLGLSVAGVWMSLVAAVVAVVAVLGVSALGSRRRTWNLDLASPWCLHPEDQEK